MMSRVAVAAEACGEAFTAQTDLKESNPGKPQSLVTKYNRL